MYYDSQPMTMQGQPMQGHPMQGQPMQGQPVMGQNIYGQPMAGGQMMPTVINITYVGKPPSIWEEGPYKNRLCGCSDDLTSCVMSWICPCIQFGQNYEQIHKGQGLRAGIAYAAVLLFAVPCVVHGGFRKELREKFNVSGTSLEDFAVTGCCFCCAVAQDAREIAYRKEDAARRGLPFY